ncbi:MAG: RusA family crossover junction endodeoxyribonuclease [Aerococcus suis]|nr:RusA family crossover junction endodeoxyribonuclease [Aerococcus suis]
MTKLIFPITPVPQGRPRFARRGNYVSTYDPPKSKAFKKRIGIMAKTFLDKNGEQPFEKYVPIEITIDFYIPTLKSFSKKRTAEAEKKYILPVKRPDLDNYTKGVLDGLNGVLFHDDGQIVKMTLNKFYSQTPRIEIEIKEVVMN